MDHENLQDIIHHAIKDLIYHVPNFILKNSHLQLQLMKIDIHAIKDLIMVDLLRRMELSWNIEVLFLTIHPF